jgi:outer membrane receptor protein involved in Fe transport
LATRTIDYTNDTGISGQQIAQLAGRNDEGGAGVPKWKALFTQSWTNNVLTLNLTERLVSAGKIDPEAIVCTSNCPASTVQHPTYNFNSIPGAVYVDFGATYKLPHDLEVYFKVDNVFNHRSPPFGASTLYDQIGTMFRLGARIKI